MRKNMPTELFKRVTVIIFLLSINFIIKSQTISKLASGFHNPTGVCVDDDGQIYIADYGNHEIKKIDTTGNVILIAGTGNIGYSGDGGLATEAELNFPYRLCLDKNGNIYFSDQQNNVIRKISANGIITTIAGNGIRGYAGDDGLATQAQLNNPLGICLDSIGNLFIADGFNHRIRKVSINGIITTIAGSGSTGSYNGGYSGDGSSAKEAHLNLPTGIVIDSKGVLYITEEYNSIIRKIDTDGIISTLAGNVSLGRGYYGDGGLAINAKLNGPLDIGIDNAANIYITDESNFVVRKIDAQGIITTFAGNGIQSYTDNNGIKLIHASFGNPNGVFVANDGSVYFTDNGQNFLYKISN